MSRRASPGIGKLGNPAASVATGSGLAQVIPVEECHDLVRSAGDRGRGSRSNGGCGTCRSGPLVAGVATFRPAPRGRSQRIPSLGDPSPAVLQPSAKANRTVISRPATRSSGSLGRALELPALRERTRRRTAADPARRPRAIGRVRRSPDDRRRRAGWRAHDAAGSCRSRTGSGRPRSPPRSSRRRPRGSRGPRARASGR